jgi:alpha-tubulin suppressor-like RCC1 family protein
LAQRDAIGTFPSARAKWRLKEEAQCTFTSDCKPPLRCAVDQQCRNACEADVDCIKGQVCAATKSCADPAEVDAVTKQLKNAKSSGSPDGGAQSTPDAGPSCTAGGACDPGIPCHTGSYGCDANKKRVCRDTGNLTDGTNCDTGKVCKVGACVVCNEGGACSPDANNPCRIGTMDCKNGARCVDKGLAQDGAACGTDKVCKTGSCADCKVGGPCSSDVNDSCKQGTLACDNGPVCTSGAPPSADGTKCGADKVCSGGACTPCKEGEACVAGSSCQIGARTCATGPTCVVSGPASDGTKCGTDSVCKAGSCVACIQDSVCTPTNPCHVGKLDCASGTPSCVDTTVNVAVGGSCGSGMVCSPTADCVACVTGASCKPTIPLCRTGVTSCVTGVAVCNATGNAPDTTVCGVGQICTAGTCAVGNVDECATGQSNCDINATCADTPTAFTCTCKAGYTGNGVTCADVDECAIATSCSPNAVCTNSPGSFSCVCNAGFVGNGKVCDKAFAQLDAGDLHVCGVRGDGTLWCWGYNGYSQLGDGTTTTRDAPTQVGKLKTWSKVSGGSSYTCAVRTDGTLWCWGYNASGQLGMGSTGTYTLPVKVGADANWADVATGASHTCAVKSDGTLWCWGANGQGQLGDGAATPRTLPSQVGAVTTWSKVYASGNSTCAKKADGSLWCWGQNNYGQLGDGTNIDRAAPVQVFGAVTTWANVGMGTASVCATRTDGSLWCWGQDNYGQYGNGTINSTPATDSNLPLHIGALTTWATVSMSGNSACATRTDNTVWCWGYNGYGQIGNGTTVDSSTPVAVTSTASWTQTAVSDYTSCGLQTDGTVWCWGYDGYGQLGNGAVGTTNVPGQLHSNACTTYSDNCDPNALCANTASGFDCTCNPGFYGNGTQCADTDECADATSSCSPVADCTNTAGGFTCACQTGFVGNGEVCDMAFAQLAIGSLHTCGIRSDGTLWCWGYNGYGQLGEGTVTTRDAPTQVGKLTTWAKVATGDNYTCGVRTDGTLWCWGYNGYGELGIGSVATYYLPVKVGADSSWADVAAGTNHTCAVKTDGTLWCWGYDGQGQLGDGAAGTRALPTQVGALTTWSKVYAGGNTACSKKTDGSLWCWGQNNYGQIGDGTNIDRAAPVQVFGSVTTWASVSLGTNNACATRTDGSLWCWGNDNYGQYGNGTVNATPATDSNLPLRIGSLTTWSTVSIDAYFTCATRTDGSLWCTGYNAYGQLGDSSTTSQTRFVRSGFVFSQLRPLPGGSIASDWTSVVVSDNTACGLRTNGTVYCWGYDGYGQLGNGSTGSTNLPGQVQSNACTTHKDSCDANAFCTSTATGTACACNAGYTGNGTSCADIDECSASTSTCSPQALCTNTAGGYTCGCNTGYVGGGEVCDRAFAQVELGESTGHACGIRANGTLWCWGYNGYGQLGDGTTATRDAPTQVGKLTTWASVSGGANFTCAVRTNGTLWCWGYDGYGQLANGSTTNLPLPTQVGVATDWTAVSAGSNHACALKAGGTLWCWGYDAQGQLGDGAVTTRTSPAQVGVLTTWSKLYTGGNSTCAKQTNNSLWCWGQNNLGQLGDGTIVDKGTPVQVFGSVTSWANVSMGTNNVCATQADGSLWCWGNNDYGQYGNGTSGAATDSNVPVHIGALTTWSTVAVGAQAMCATRTDGSLWCTGYNAYGELGDGSTTSQTRLVRSGFVVAVQQPKLSGFITSDWTGVSAGDSTMCGMRSNGTVYCWGYDGYGELGNGTIGTTNLPSQLQSNACTTGTDNCHPTLALCTNNAGNFTCTCNPPATGNGVTCL